MRSCRAWRPVAVAGWPAGWQRWKMLENSFSKLFKALVVKCISLIVCLLARTFRFTNGIKSCSVSIVHRFMLYCR